MAPTFDNNTCGTPTVLRYLMHVLIALTAALGAGCGPATPLKMLKDSGSRGPWCAPNQRVQLGQRVVGKVGWGEDNWKTFLVDDAGREYDPSIIANQVWTYLERTGDAARIMHAYHQDGQYTRMTVIALKPLVVVLESRPLSPGTSRSIAAPERSYWVAQISSERSHPEYREGLRWCSPDLKQPVTPLTFSPAGEAEIPLPNGRLRLIRSADECRTTRE